MILLDTGLRIGELINLSMEDTQMDEGYLKVLGKTNHELFPPYYDHLKVRLTSLKSVRINVRLVNK